MEPRIWVELECGCRGAISLPVVKILCARYCEVHAAPLRGESECCEKHRSEIDIFNAIMARLDFDFVCPYCGNDQSNCEPLTVEGHCRGCKRDLRPLFGKQELIGLIVKPPAWVRPEPESRVQADV